MDDDHRTPWQADRDEAERTGRWPESWGPFHRHFANDAVHRDGGRECDQPGTPRRVYVFDPDYLHEHELTVARYAIAHPEQFTPEPGDDQSAPAAVPPGITCPQCERTSYNPNDVPASYG